ncbi:MAG: DUF1648 domain-containing protein [Algicola sp.]|nr:DUF1648 domain-containing protein [Algicola sp.]
MKTNRPKIAVPKTPLDIIIDLITATIILLMFVYTAINYSELPEIVPSHFNGKGEVDGRSDKYILWLLPCIGLVTFVGLYILNKYPHIHNYMVNITEDNALKNYRLSTRIVRFTNLFVAVVFSVVLFTIIQTAQGHTLRLGSWFIPVIIGLSILLPIIILIYNQKINKSE